MAKKKLSSNPVWIARLEDLRKRLIIMGVCILSAGIASFVYIDKVRGVLLAPAGNPELIYITPAEALMANIRLAFSTGILITLPILLYQAIALAWPLLTRERKKVMVVLPVFMILLFAAGLFFAYEVVYPIAIEFFQSFEDDTLVAMFTLQNYLSFSLSFLFAFGLVFQLPIVFLFLGVLGIVNPPLLRSNRKFAILIMLVLSALITPPDIFSQFLMIGPLIILYEIGILLVVLSQRRKKNTELIDDNDNISDDTTV